MHKNTPSEFAHLGFSCLIQSALDAGLFLCAPPSDSKDSNLMTCSRDKEKSEDQHMLSLEWYIEPSEEKGYFFLVSAVDAKRPHLLHLGENFEQDGDPITLVEKNKAFENTKLRFDEVPDLDGHYFMSFFKMSGMASRTTDSKRVVHVDQESGQVTQWEKTMSPACYWRFLPARLSPRDLVAADEHNCFAIENKTGGWLFLKGGSIFNGTQVTAGPFINQPHFKWRIKRAGEDKYLIISARDAHHDRVLQQHDNTLDDGAKITLWEIDPEEKNCLDSSMVKFEPAGDEGGNWCMLFCHSNRYIQMHLGELTQVRKRSTQVAPEPNWCWSFVRCIPNFPKNA